MKLFFTFVALFGIVVSSYAQQPLLLTPEGKQVDTSKSYRVPSPNRTSSKALARSSTDKKNHPDKGKNLTTAAILWVDSTGKTIGRALSSSAILVPYENQLALLTGLDPERNCDRNNVCTYSGGMQWATYYSVNYASADCTGTAYGYGGAQGTLYASIPIIDNDGDTYLYFFKSSDTERVTINSYFFNGVCNAPYAPYDIHATPVMAVVPASAYGTAPYFLK